MRSVESYSPKDALLTLTGYDGYGRVRLECRSTFAYLVLCYLLSDQLQLDMMS